jgi:histidinol-phosphate aminotransferase
MGYFNDNVESMEGYTPGLQPADMDIVKLNTNENPYPPSPKVMSAINQIPPEKLRRYPDPAGNIFRDSAANVHNLSRDNIMCCNGGDDLLNIAIRAFCDNNRPVAYPVPTYSLYPVLAKLQNCPVIEVPFDSEFNLPAKLARTGAALTIVCNPNAPTGSVVSVEELASLAQEISGVLLIDEAYVDFADRNCLELIRQFQNVIILRSMSKGYSLAGIRFGYAIADASLIQGLMKVKDSYNVDVVSITAATEAIKDQDYFKENVEKIKTQRQHLTTQLKEMGFDVPGSQTNFLFGKHKSVKAPDIYNMLIQQKIYVRYFDLPGIDNCLRITVGTPEQNEIFLQALKKIVSK